MATSWPDWRPDITIDYLGGGDVQISWTVPPSGDLATLDGGPGYYIELFKSPFSGGDYDSYIGAGGTPPDPSCTTVNIPSGGFDACADLSAVFHDVPYGTHFHFYIEADGDGATFTNGAPSGGAWSFGEIDLGVIAMGDSRVVDGSVGPDFALNPTAESLTFTGGGPSPQTVDIDLDAVLGDTEYVNLTNSTMPAGFSGGFTSPGSFVQVGNTVHFQVTRTGAMTTGTVTITGTGDTTGNVHTSLLTIDVVGPDPVLQTRFPTV